MKYHQYFLANINEDSTILDIGCGIGALAYDLSKKAKNVVAIDISKNAIKFARERYSRENIKYIIGDATIYDFNESYDYIILSNVLEHIKDRNNFLKKIIPLAKQILIRVPIFNRSWLTLYKKQLGMEYKLDPTHYIEYTYNSFLNEMDNSGLKIIDYSIQFGEIWAKLE